MPHHLLVGRTVREVYRSMREAEEDIAYCVEALRTGAAIVVDDMITEGYVDGHGRDIVVDVRVVPIDEDSVSYGWRDVTERHVAQRRLAESEERLRLLAENMSDVVSLVREDLIEWISPSVTHSLGWQQSDLVGGSPGDMLEPDDAARMQSIWADVTEGTLPRLRCRVRCADGSRRWMDIDGSLVGDGERRTIVLAARLVDAEVHALEELETLARRDALTGLINRHAIFEQIGRALAGSVRSGNRVAFVFCDLDEFKDVNDAHGHAAGDAVLRTIAQRLENAVRAGDVIARMGGDEFLVVLNGVHDLENATLIAQKLHDEVGRPIEIHDGCVAVGSSMGVTLAEEGETLDDIIARADAHMYSAKRGGKDQVITLDPGEPG
jgi:diguanylate cyclase (GGDEF)-like protein/PAS domain S-box-containing protein